MIRVFISYSSKNRVEKDELVSYLKVLETEDSTASVEVDPWDDSKIGIGEEWEKKIAEALQEAQIAILLVTTNFLTSEFIMKKELNEILERHQTEDLIVVPVIARHCAWKQAARISKLEVFNKGQVIWDGKREDIEERLTALTDEVANCAKRLSSTPHPSPAAGNIHAYGQVLDEISIPESIRPFRKTIFKLKFHSDVPYARIRFDVESKHAPIHIRRKNADHSEVQFEFNFAQGESRKQTFSLQADNPEKDSLFALTILCFNEAGKMIATPEVRLIRIHGQPPPPKDYKDLFGAAIWFWYWLRFSTWYVKTIIIVAGMVTISLSVYVAVPRAYQERLKLRLIWPTAQTEGFSDEFPKTENFKEKWQFSDNQPQPLVDGKGGDPTRDGALKVSADQSALVRSDFIRGNSFYDFKLHFAFRYAPKSSRAGWILHAQRDGQRGYLFELEKKGARQFDLSGVVADLSTSPSAISGDRSRSIFFAQDVKDDDIINIKVTVYDCSFHYTIWIEHEGAPESEQQTAEFKDETLQFPYGTVGVKEPPSNEIIVEFWRMDKTGFRIPELISSPSPK